MQAVVASNDNYKKVAQAHDLGDRFEDQREDNSLLRTTRLAAGGSTRAIPRAAAFATVRITDAVFTAACIAAA